MPRKKRTPPKFKVGDWVRIAAHDRVPRIYKRFSGKVFQIKKMDYDSGFETCPSPWSCRFDKEDCYLEIFEEDLEYDVFLTAAHNAVKTKTKESTNA